MTIVLNQSERTIFFIMEKFYTLNSIDVPVSPIIKIIFTLFLYYLIYVFYEDGFSSPRIYPTEAVHNWVIMAPFILQLNHRAIMPGLFRRITTTQESDVVMM